MITIKKYSNRRLYDTSESRYITLEDLAATIRAGTDVRVVDAKSDEDITQQTLAQIILESRGAAKLLPVPLLMRLIRMGEDNLAEFFGQFMSWGLDVYLQLKRGYQSGGAFNPFAQMPFAEMNPLWRMFGGGQDGGGGWGGRAPWSRSPGAGKPATRQPAEPAEPPPEPAPPADEPTAYEQAFVEASEARSTEVAELRREMDELKALIRGLKDSDG